MHSPETFSIAHTTRSYPRGPYREIKEDILGARYALSLVFVGETRAQALNKTYRNKTYVPNVLSFPLEKDAGEIYICLSVAKRQAKQYGMTYPHYVRFLLIHGLLHLKGLPHGDTMDRAEARYRVKYELG